jgi:hypothetical protein
MSNDEKVQSVAKVLENTTDAITIAALLERMEMQWDEAQEASDGKKSEIKKVTCHVHALLNVYSLHQ